MAHQSVIVEACGGAGPKQATTPGALISHVWGVARAAIISWTGVSQNPNNSRLAKARNFLEKNAKQLHSITSTGHTIRDNFTQILILEATGNRDLVYLEEHERTWNFFIGTPVLTTTKYPDDLDTTAAALLTLKTERGVLTESLLDEMLANTNEDGIICTYYDPKRPRIDPVVCVNVLRLFYSHERGAQVARTLKWVEDVLHERSYLHGTRYYPTPEAFLYFLCRFLQTSCDEDLCGRLTPSLRKRITERIGIPGDALCIAMRLLVCSSIGVSNPIDMDALCSKQCDDGGWEAGSVYRYGKTGILIGNRGLSTALSISAIREHDSVPNA